MPSAGSPRGEGKTLAVNLLLSGRRCLIAGGGKVAARKLKALLNAAAKPVVVAPEISPTVEELCKSPGAELRVRKFADADLDGIFLAFAATDDRALNKHVAELCKEKGILCCAVDANWPSGSFLTPASIETAGLKIAISSGGASCRRSRLLKDSLAKHVEMLEGTDIIAIGVDHTCLPLAERERLHLSGAKLQETAQLLSCIWGLHEFLLLNTCNRVELAGIVSPGENIAKLIAKTLGMEGVRYVKRSWDAFEHMTALAAGLLSQTPGEKHIVSQLKESLELAKDQGWAGSMMQNWLDSALHISKDIRAKTETACSPCEIEELAIKFAQERLGSLKESQVVVIGSGKIGTALVRRLQGTDCKTTWLYHSKQPAPLPDVAIAPLEELAAKVKDCKVLLAAASTPVPLLADASKIPQGTLLIDLGIPRNIAPSILDGRSDLELVDLEALRKWNAQEFIDLERLLKISAEITNEHREMHEKLIASLQGRDA